MVYKYKINVYVADTENQGNYIIEDLLWVEGDLTKGQIKEKLLKALHIPEEFVLEYKCKSLLIIK